MDGTRQHDGAANNARCGTPPPPDDRGEGARGTPSPLKPLRSPLKNKSSPLRGANRLESKRDLLLRRLKAFYADPAHLDVLTSVLNPQGGAKPGISLRVLDWLITNYAKKRTVVYELPSGEAFNVYVMYKAQLDGYSKKFFDPFCRRERLTFVDARGLDFVTTVGQLNFFRWAIAKGVVAYGILHAPEIERDMLEAARQRAPPPKANNPRRFAQSGKRVVLAGGAAAPEKLEESLKKA